MAKRIFQAVVLFFAIYAFVFVPLGRKTALEHVRAIAGTPAAHQAATELQGGVKRLVHRLRDEAQRTTAASDEDEEFASEEEKPTPPERSRTQSAPKSRPVELSGGASTPRKGGPERLSREPAAAASALGPSQLNPTGLEPPDLQELRSRESSRSTR